MLIYPDSPGPMTGMWWRKLDPTTQYLNHYSNSLILKMFLQKRTTLEKIQAGKELKICERKMEFWQRMDGYDQAAAIKGCTDLKAQWD